MQKIFIFILTFIFSHTLIAQDYAWPVHATYMLSGTFAEYRSGHFHAGVDFKTNGQDGYPVFAVADGSVSRVIVSPYGGGKSIMLKLNSGLTTAYLHLSRFAHPIEQIIQKQQQQAGKYRVEKWFSPGEMFFRQGDLIAFSGHTGTQYAHLHFEVRDDLGRPFNPLLMGYKINDQIPPTIEKIAVTPLGGRSHVHFDFCPKIYAPVQLSKGRFFIPDTIDFYGEIGLAAMGYDRANGAPNQNGVYQTMFFLGDSLFFSAVYDTFSYDHWTYTCFDWDYQLQKRGMGRFRKLYRDPENPLSFYTMTNPDLGVVDSEKLPGVSEQVYPFRIDLIDFWGNTSICRGWLRKKSLPVFKSKSSANVVYFEQDSIAFQYSIYDDYIRFEINSPEPTVRIPCLHVWKNNWHCAELPVYANAGKWVARYPLSTLKNQWLMPGLPDYFGPMPLDTLSLHSVAPGQQDLIVSGDGVFQLEFSGNELYRPFHAVFEKYYLHIGKADSVVCYEVRHNDQPFRNPCKVRMEMPVGITRDLSVYTSNGQGGFVFLKSYSEGGWLSTRSSSPGRFVILRDTLAPEILKVTPTNGAVVDHRKPEISVWFTDSLSGISSENHYRIYLDGEPCIVQYDYAWDAAHVQLYHCLAAGMHDLHFIIQDRMGNKTERRSRFYIK